MGGAGLDRYGDEPLPPPPKGDGRGGSRYGGGGGCLVPPFFLYVYKKKSREQEYKELSEIKRKKMMFQHSVAFAEFQITITSTQDDECVWKAP